MQLIVTKIWSTNYEYTTPKITTYSKISTAAVINFKYVGIHKAVGVGGPHQRHSIILGTASFG